MLVEVKLKDPANTITIKGRTRTGKRPFLVLEGEELKTHLRAGTVIRTGKTKEQPDKPRRGRKPKEDGDTNN